MPRFILLMRDEQQALGALSPPDDEVLMKNFIGWTQQLQQGGVLRVVEKLAGDRGKTLRFRAGAFTVDGPFAEAKEAVVGLYILEARDLSHALELSQGCPLLGLGGSLEVRLIDDFPMPA